MHPLEREDGAKSILPYFHVQRDIAHGLLKVWRHDNEKRYCRSGVVFACGELRAIRGWCVVLLACCVTQVYPRLGIDDDLQFVMCHASTVCQPNFPTSLPKKRKG